jgi:hypothetical protein
MITIKDLQLMLDDATGCGYVKPDSEVRFITRNNLGNSKDCSFEPEWRSIGPGVNKSGVPVDRRYGDGCLFLAQESELRDTPKQLMLAFDW